MMRKNIKLLSILHPVLTSIYSANYTMILEKRYNKNMFDRFM